MPLLTSFGCTALMEISRAGFQLSLLFLFAITPPPLVAQIVAAEKAGVCPHEKPPEKRGRSLRQPSPSFAHLTRAHAQTKLWQFLLEF